MTLVNNVIYKFIEYAVLSPYFNKRGIGINLLLIARPESGKSYNLKPFRVINRIMFLQDLTYSALVTNLEKISKEKIRTIIIPDMSKIFSKKSYTISQLITALNLLMEEGILSLQIGDRYVINFDKPVICNIIGATTFSSFKRIFRLVGDIEFISRLLPVSFQLSEAKIEEILDNLDEELVSNIELPKEDYVEIGISKEHKLYLYRVAKDLLPSIYGTFNVHKEDMPYGIRLTRSLILMSMVNAWKEGRDNVTDQDIRIVESMAKKWVGFNFELI